MNNASKSSIFRRRFLHILMITDENIEVFFIFDLTFEKMVINYKQLIGVLAQLARAPRWQRGGQEFKSLILHHDFPSRFSSGFFCLQKMRSRKFMPRRRVALATRSRATIYTVKDKPVLPFVDFFCLFDGLFHKIRFPLCLKFPVIDRFLI